MECFLHSKHALHGFSPQTGFTQPAARRLDRIDVEGGEKAEKS
jgi:hypothetical protein